jgi:hypothetical protein
MATVLNNHDTARIEKVERKCFGSGSTLNCWFKKSSEDLKVIGFT